jgi:hypothetical protein
MVILNQFAIRNSQFAITFCNGDLTPTQNVLPSLGRGLKPPKFVKTVEVTRGKTPVGSAHPHFHVLMMVKPSYFTHGYLSQAKWVEMWQKSLRIDYKPILDVQALKPQDSLIGLLAEVIKTEYMRQSPEFRIEFCVTGG